jgi:hypothetical protein
MLAASASSSSNCAAKLALLPPLLLPPLLLLMDASGASLLRGLLRALLSALLSARPAVGDSGCCWCARPSEPGLLHGNTEGAVGELGCCCRCRCRCCCCCCWRRRWASSAAAAAGDLGRGLCGWLREAAAAVKDRGEEGVGGEEAAEVEWASLDLERGVEGERSALGVEG